MAWSQSQPAFLNIVWGSRGVAVVETDCVLCTWRLWCHFRHLHGLSWSQWMPRSLGCMITTTSSRKPWTWALSRYGYPLSLTRSTPAIVNSFYPSYENSRDNESSVSDQWGVRPWKCSQNNCHLALTPLSLPNWFLLWCNPSQLTGHEAPSMLSILNDSSQQEQVCTFMKFSVIFLTVPYGYISFSCYWRDLIVSSTAELISFHWFDWQWEWQHGWQITMSAFIPHVITLA